MTLDRFTDVAEVAQPMSPTAHLLEELALYANRPFDDEADPRPLPEPATLQGALADMFDALVATLRHPSGAGPARPAVVARERVPPPHRLDRARPR